MIGDRTYKYIRHTFGTLKNKNIYSHSFGYTETQNKVAAGAVAAVMAATAPAANAEKTIVTGFTQPDVPRALAITPGGTTGDIQESVITIYGTNVEGAAISEEFRFAADASTQVAGNKAFKTVTSVVMDGQLSTDPTFSIDTTNKLGVFHRLFNKNTTVKVFSATTVGTGSDSLTLQAAPTVVSSEDEIERNLVTPATTPDGTTFLTIAYTYDNWEVSAVFDDPAYSTSTSTSSTSSSTSTTTAPTTSTSSTSSSTSSTSSSISSTSSSTSSTSTSTTTVA